MADKFLKAAKLRRMRAQAVPASDSQLTLTYDPNDGLRPGGWGSGVGVYHVDRRSWWDETYMIYLIYFTVSPTISHHHPPSEFIRSSCQELWGPKRSRWMPYNKKVQVYVRRTCLHDPMGWWVNQSESNHWALNWVDTTKILWFRPLNSYLVQTINSN